MPYIDPTQREKFDKIISESILVLEQKGKPIAGEINYMISSVLWKLFEHNKNYDFANSLIGVLEAIKLEFYRRKVSIYEDEKIIQNGDI